jgi:hypothetical protein
MKKAIKLVIGLGILNLLFLSNCATTAMYGKTLEPDPIVPGQFTFKVYTGGTAWAEAARERAVVEINKYMSLHNYSKYQIVDEKCELFPTSGCNFVVKLER